MLGLLVCDETNLCKYYSFWADARGDEAQIWQQFTEMVNQYTDAPIYHYGDYEVRAIAKLAKRYESDVDVEGIKNRLVNVNTHIYGQVYFPVYSNGLKAIGKFIGATWTSPEASGLQSIVWRCHWEDKRAIRHLAVQRKISGTFFESLAPQYLLLLGIMQTCRFQEKSLLKFLLSKEKDIDQFK